MKLLHWIVSCTARIVIYVVAYFFQSHWMTSVFKIFHTACFIKLSKISSMCALERLSRHQHPKTLSFRCWNDFFSSPHYICDIKLISYRYDVNFVQLKVKTVLKHSSLCHYCRTVLFLLGGHLSRLKIIFIVLISGTDEICCLSSLLSTLNSFTKWGYPIFNWYWPCL